MKEYSVAMSLFDYLPVILFGIGAIIFQRDLYEKMGKGQFALFAAGTIDVIAAGALKATYKLLYALGVCDFEPLNSMFFPVQSIGFLLAGLGIVAMLCYKPKKQTKALAVAAPAVWKGTFLFVGLMVAGLAMMDFGFIKLAAKLKKKGTIVLIIISFICCMGMGYLSSKSFDKASMNWIAEGVNFVGQLTFLISAVSLHRAGLAKS